MAMRLRRRVAELEARLEALETRGGVDYTMPPRPDIGGVPVDTHVLWRERCVEYGAVLMEDVDDDRARPGVYL
jgi:hypothetical protein